MFKTNDSVAPVKSSFTQEAPKAYVNVTIEGADGKQYKIGAVAIRDNGKVHKAILANQAKSEEFKLSVNLVYVDDTELALAL
jgi:hypothetical protein